MHSIWNFHWKIFLHSSSFLENIIESSIKGNGNKSGVNKACSILINSHAYSKSVKLSDVAIIHLL
jgi:hypothetical protein